MSEVIYMNLLYMYMCPSCLLSTYRTLCIKAVAGILTLCYFLDDETEVVTAHDLFLSAERYPLKFVLTYVHLIKTVTPSSN